MRAGDLLAALSIKAFEEEYEAIYFQSEKQLIPFTSIEIDQVGDLVLYHENQKPPLLIKDLLIKLMLNKKQLLTYWSGREKNIIFGYRVEKEKIII